MKLRLIFFLIFFIIIYEANSLCARAFLSFENNDNIKIAANNYEKLKQNRVYRTHGASKTYIADLDETGRWEKPWKITVYIDPEDKRANLLKHAFKKWDKALYSLVDFYYVDSPEKANIIAKTVSYNELLKLDSRLKNQTVGLTTYEMMYYKIDPSKKYLYKAYVYVSSNYGIKEYSDTQYIAIALHEIGHALGIKSHSKSKTDIMYEDTSSYRNSDASLSSRDINTVELIYGKH